MQEPPPVLPAPRLRRPGAHRPRAAVLASLCILVALLATAAATAQPAFTQAQQVRVAYGDIPTTQDTEPAGLWNVQETRRVQVEEGPVPFLVPPGATFRLLACDVECNTTASEDEAHRTVTFPEAAAGEATVTFAYSFPGDGGRLAATFALEADSVLVLFVPTGATVAARTPVGEPLPCTAAPCDIYTFTPGAGAFWVAAGVAAVAPAPDRPVFDWVSLAIGVAAGALLWSLLVARGIVQRRTRRQVAGIAAHKEAAARESKALLQARKRILMAGLKDLELARQEQEVEADAYDALKAEWKKQTVTVMRALEDAGGK